MKILVIDDDVNIQGSLKWLLETEGYQVTLCGNGEEALVQASSTSFDVAFCDVMMPVMGGIETLEQLRKEQPLLKVIMISGQSDIPTAVKATKLGAFDFMEKPLKPEKVILEIKKLAQQQRIENEIAHLKTLFDLDEQMIGQSPQIQKLRELIAKVAPTEGRILIYGPNGSGKELVARHIHHQSGRLGRFVQLNCAALPKELIESELFGYEKGAFTGAHKRKIGLIEEAADGTLLLDEIGDMALETQAKLLRVLQENEFTPVGSTKPIKFDVRIISATNKDLQTEIKNGNFRHDLFFRLNVIPITVPPLCERREDVAILADHFLKTYALRNGKRPKVLLPGALAKMLEYSWPGNVRELRNICDRLCILIPQDEIEAADIDQVAGISSEIQIVSTASGTIKNDQSLKQQCSDFEKQVLLSAFHRHQGNISHIAQALQTDRANLHKKLKRYGIK
ncbi:MAG: sigma-54-dependent Fis family transcriptional regulator [Calditrichaeota bacterium]|nr:MAG: sigma-54-dependent Fis family transcriptional regulator [Calditrichota bacterium]